MYANYCSELIFYCLTSSSYVVLLSLLMEIIYLLGELQRSQKSRENKDSINMSKTDYIINFYDYVSCTS